MLNNSESVSTDAADDFLQTNLSQRFLEWDEFENVFEVFYSV